MWHIGRMMGRGSCSGCTSVSMSQPSNSENYQVITAMLCEYDWMVVVGW